MTPLKTLNSMAALGAILLSVSAQAGSVASCNVPNINPEGTAQAASVVIEQSASGELSATLKVDPNSETLKAEAVDPNDLIAKIYINGFESEFKQENPNYAKYTGYGLIGAENSFPTSKYVGVLLTAYDKSGAALGTELLIGFGGGRCQ